MTEEITKPSTEMTQPVIIDLGKQRRRRIKDLKNGEGKLWDDVLDVIEEVKEMLGVEADSKVLVPIVLIYKEKTVRRRVDLNRILFPLLEEDDYDDDEDDDEED
jgi:hypothetical protein